MEWKIDGIISLCVSKRWSSSEWISINWLRTNSPASSTTTSSSTATTAAPSQSKQSRANRECFTSTIKYASAGEFKSRDVKQNVVLIFLSFQTLNQSENNGNNSNNNNAKSSGKLSSAASLSLTSDVEEINTKELAQRISAELKRYSIPQAIFAQRVLCRSQGTLSDLLRNPKPWSKLKSGRETFRRMAKWLQEPEYQRMSALRLAGENVKREELEVTKPGVSFCSLFDVQFCVRVET